MAAWTSALLELRQQRILLLHLLAKSLESACDALLKSELRQLEFQTARQQALVEAMRALDFRSIHYRPNAPLKKLLQLSEENNEMGEMPSADDEQCWEQRAREMQAAESEVRRLGLLLAALLRHARRNLGIRSRTLWNTALIYERPKPVLPGAGAAAER
jgi:hypothetical protein